MLASKYSGTTPTAIQISQMDDWLQINFGTSWRYSANNGKGSGTEPPELASLSQEYFGLTDSTSFSGWTLNQLKQELAQGYPVIVRVRPQMVASYPDAHYMVLLGMDNQWVYVNDPGIRKGAQAKYKLQDFINSWARTAARDQNNNEGVTIHNHSSPETIYTADYLGGDISAFRVDTPTGALASIVGSPYSDGSWFITISPNHKFAYTLYTTFSIDPVTGGLTNTGLYTYNYGEIVVHPSGKYAYSIGANSVIALSVDLATGVLTPLPALTVSVQPFSPIRLLMDPNGKFLYAVQGTTWVSVYAVDSLTGALAEVNGSPFGSGVGDTRSAVVHPSGRFLYVMGGNADASAPIQSALSVDPVTGALAPSGQQNVGRLLNSAVIDSSGKFLYGTDLITNAILGFTIDATSGQLTPLFSLPLSFSLNALLLSNRGQKLAIDSSGHFLYVLAPQNNEVFGFSIDSSSGFLTPLSVGPFSTGGRPVWIVAN